MLEFAQKAVIFDGESVLLVERVNDEGKFLQWELPGGRIVTGEDVDESIRREVWEEVGLSIYPGDPVHLWTWTTDDGTQIITIARSSRPLSSDLSSANRPPQERLGRICWFRTSEVENLTIPEGYVTAIYLAERRRISSALLASVESRNSAISAAQMNTGKGDSRNMHRARPEDELGDGVIKWRAK